MNAIHRTTGIVIVLLALALLAAPVSAVLPEETFKGEVTSVEAAKNSIVIVADEEYGCSWDNGTSSCSWEMITPVSLDCTVPCPEVFDVIEVGDTVEATSIGGMGGKLAAIGLLVEPAGGGLVATDVFGDPASLPVPLVGDYSVEYTTVPDCSQCEGTTCPAVSANITMKSGEMTLFEAALAPGEAAGFNGRNDGSSVTVTFVSGEASSGSCPGMAGMVGPQPFSVFVIEVVPPVGFTTVTAATPAESPAAGSLPLACIGALGAALLLLVAGRR